MKLQLSAIFTFLVIFNLQAQPTISLSSVVTGLNLPIQVVNAGDGTNRIFVVLKSGLVRAYDKNYNLLEDTFAIVSGISYSPTNERGLLSIAFHPNYENNGFFFTHYTNGNGDIEISRYHVSADPNKADLSSRVIVKTIPHPTFTNHNGGEMHFGKDGYLYISTGDGGSGGDPNNNAQRDTVLLGKMLRININTSATAPYFTIPPDNPFGNEVYAKGLRNPFRWEFDRLNDDMWIGDVGQDAFEEFDHRRRDSSKAANYGWRCYEGNNTYNTTGCSTISNYVFPFIAYPTASAGGSAIGGCVYRGETYIDFRGYYLGVDFYTKQLFRVKYDSLTNAYDTSSQQLTPAGISDFGETEDGEMYATCLNNGTLYRVVSSGSIQYTFTGNGDWDVADNWSNKIIPPTTLTAGNVIVIRPIQNGECVLSRQQTISTGAKFIVETNKQFRVTGNLTVQ